MLAWGNTGTSGTGPSREPGGQNDREDRTPRWADKPTAEAAPQHRRRQRGNASRNRRPPRGPKRQLHPGRRFSTQIHTWRIAWLAMSSETKMRASPPTRCEHNPSYQPYRRSSRPGWNCACSRSPPSSPRSNWRSCHCGSRSRWLNPGGIFPPSQPRFSPCAVQPGGVLPLCQSSLPPELLNCRGEPEPLRLCAPEEFTFVALLGL